MFASSIVEYGAKPVDPPVDCLCAADVAALRSGIATDLQVPLGQRDEDSGQSDVGRRPVCRLDEGNLFEQIGGASYAFHRIDQGVFVLDVQRAVITGGPKVVDEVGPKRRATGVPSPSVT